MKRNDEFYLKWEEPYQSCLLALRDIIKDVDSEIVEGWKYDSPCFIYRNGLVCYIWVNKKLKLPYLLIVDGNMIEHPSLEQGDRKRMKVLYVDPSKDIPIQNIQEVLFQSLKIIDKKKAK